MNGECDLTIAWVSEEKRKENCLVTTDVEYFIFQGIALDIDYKIYKLEVFKMLINILINYYSKCFTHINKIKCYKTYSKSIF